MKNSLIAVFLIALLSACSYSEKPKEVKTEMFEVSYPGYMKSTDDLLEGADLQYKNAYRNIYSIVKVSDKGTQTFEDFQKKTVDVIRNFQLLEKPVVTDSVYRENDNFKAIDLQIYGIMNNENIYYWHSVFETKDKFYELAVWTRTMDRKQRYGEDIAKIIESFKPLR
ncbi:MAG: hypothetical protein H6578_04275 [Chitinophagales bacterium]|nr:hypothetical protein [Chitinophagales bacterium]